MDIHWEKTGVCVDCYMTAAGYEVETEGHYPPLHFMQRNYVETDSEIEPWFSWCVCPGCHTQLGGDRYQVSVGWDVEVTA